MGRIQCLADLILREGYFDADSLLCDRRKGLRCQLLRPLAVFPEPCGGSGAYGVAASEIDTAVSNKGVGELGSRREIRTGQLQPSLRNNCELIDTFSEGSINILHRL